MICDGFSFSGAKVGFYVMISKHFETYSERWEKPYKLLYSRKIAHKLYTFGTFRKKYSSKETKDSEI